MKALADVVAAIEAAGGAEYPWGYPCLDGREVMRLAAWVPTEEWPRIGVGSSDGMRITREPDPWTREALIEQLGRDVAFGFEKALNKRGISADLMFHVVGMWLWVLESPLADDRTYAQYGLPRFKAVALEFGFPNPIGDARGDEYRFSAEADS